MKFFTLGEIYRQKLLLNHKGKPYTAKATISRIVNRLKFKTVLTAYGPGKLVSMKEIQKWNKHW